MKTIGPGAGTGRTGFWQVGVWVEPDDDHRLDVPYQSPCGLTSIKDNRQTAEVLCGAHVRSAGVGC